MGKLTKQEFRQVFIRKYPVFSTISFLNRDTTYSTLPTKMANTLEKKNTKHEQ